MDLPNFELIVREAIATFPDHIRDQLRDVAIVIEKTPPPGKVQHGLLLGLYEGVPLTAWGRDASGKVTDKITLYQDSILRIARSPEEIPDIIRDTLRHEIGHYFGFDHDAIREMERRWRAQRRGKL